MFNTIKIYFVLFIGYSFCGWIMEVCLKLIERKKFVNRGFLLGPYCSIYGCGAILITVLLNSFKDKPVILFIMSVLLCGILEYLTSFFMEKMFYLRWWDYSDRKININGRVCLNTIILFGILGMIIIYITNPLILGKIYAVEPNILTFIFYILLLGYVVDNVISLITILNIRNATVLVNQESRKDNTEEVTKKVRDILLGNSFNQSRLVNAYPKLQAVRIQFKEKIEQSKEKIERKKSILEEKVDVAKGKASRKLKMKYGKMK